MEETQPEMTIIIPLYQSNLLIGDTCESIRAQVGVKFEVLFIDSKDDHSAGEIVKSYQDPRFRVQVLSNGTLFALINRGVLLARGRYVNILLAGSTYLAPTSLSVVYKSICKQQDPDIFYTASCIEGRLYYSADWQQVLKKGFQPTLLQACFFKAELFKRTGYFLQDLDRRGTLEFFCRACATKEITVSSEFRVFTEMVVFPQALLSKWTIFKETWSVILHYVGLRSACRWLFSKHAAALIRKKYLLDYIVPRT